MRRTISLDGDWERRDFLDEGWRWSDALVLPADCTELLVLEVVYRVDGRAPVESRRLFSRTADLEPLRRVALAELDATVAMDGPDGWAVRLSVEGAAAAIEVRLADARKVGWPERVGAAYSGTNLVTLLPGDTRTVAIEWRDVDPADRGVRLTGWNVSPRVLTSG